MSITYTSLQNLPIFDQFRFIKAEAKRLHKLELKTQPYKSYLNRCARRCGYKSYDAFFAVFNTELARIRNQGKADCAQRCDDPDREYFYINMEEDFQYTFFSHWTGWDSEGYELRAVSLINPQYFIKLVRESLKEDLYIIHDKEDCRRWMFAWKGKALVDSAIAMSSLPSLSIPKRSYSHPRLNSDLE